LVWGGLKLAKRLLILGPSFRRNKNERVLRALDRYDGVFFRVARKHLGKVKDINVIVMNDDLTLIGGNAFRPYIPPVGDTWRKQTFPKEKLKEAKKRNEKFLSKRLKGRYSEVFIAMSKKHAEALPELVKVVFPTHGGLGPKARALREWIIKAVCNEC